MYVCVSNETCTLSFQEPPTLVTQCHRVQRHLFCSGTRLEIAMMEIAARQHAIKLSVRSRWVRNVYLLKEKGKRPGVSIWGKKRRGALVTTCFCFALLNNMFLIQLDSKSDTCWERRVCVCGSVRACIDVDMHRS